MDFGQFGSHKMSAWPHHPIFQLQEGGKSKQTGERDDTPIFSPVRLDIGQFGSHKMSAWSHHLTCLATRRGKSKQTGEYI